MTKEEVYQLVYSHVEEYANANGIELDMEEGRKTRLFGGAFDSMELVALIVHIEEAIENATGKSIVLANEKAMSQRTSPFASIGLLSDYVFELLQQTEQM